MFLAFHVVAVTGEMTSSHVAPIGVLRRLQLTVFTALLVVAAVEVSDGFC